MKFVAISEVEIQQCEVGQEKTPIFQKSDIKEKSVKHQFFMNKSLLPYGTTAIQLICE